MVAIRQPPERENVAYGVALLESWGLRVEIGRHVFDRKGHFLAGSDEDRLADLNDALRDPGVRAIFCTRGGKGAYRFAHALDCEKLIGKLIVNVPVKDVECDEIWAFVQKKEKRKSGTQANDDSVGDAYCYVGIERHSKLVLNFALGRRNQATTDIFIEGLRHATGRKEFQITTDGFAPYRSAIVNTLEDRVDFAQLIKVYRAPSEGEGRYSPADIAATEVVPVCGNPDPKRICTSIVERQNLTIRMQMRRLTRLANAFSKKWDYLWAAYCLHFAHYNFCRPHRSIRVTPAMEAGIADRVWGIAELLG